MRQACKIVIYDCNAGFDFLIYKIFPEAALYRMNLGQSGWDLLSELPEDCRVVFCHINLTRTGDVISDREDLIARLRSRGATPLNWEPIDISKRALHAACRRIGLPVTLAPKEGDPREHVIIKTDLNYGGEPEMRLRAEEREMKGIPQPSTVVERLRANILSDWRGVENMYPVLPREAVEEDIWNESQLVVERFIENREKRFYRIHFLLDHVSIVEAICDTHVKKLPWCTAWTHHAYIGMEKLSDANAKPPRIGHTLLQTAHLLQRELRMDYGAFDVVLDDDGGFYFVDVNATPFWGSDKPNPVTAHLRSALFPDTIGAC